MKKILSILTILLLTGNANFAQSVIKTAADTAFLMERVYYPQLQIRMSISFLTEDFSPAPKFHYTERSIDSIEKLVRQNPGKGDYYQSLSAAHYHFHNNDAADSLSKIARDLFMSDMMKNPADTHAIRMMGNILLGEGDSQLAEAYYQELVRLAPASPTGYNGLALVKMGNYQMEPAMEFLQKAMDAEPDNIETYCQMANLQMLKAIYDLNAIDSTVLDTLSYKSLVNTRFLQEVLKKYPENPTFSAMLDALYLTGMIYQAFIDNADKLNGHGDTLSWRLRENTKKDMLLIEKRMEAHAQKTFRDREFPYSCLMLISFLNNDPVKAQQWFEKGIVYSPRSQNMYENITGVCALSLHKDCAFTNQLKLDSIHPTVTNFLMTAYFYYLDKNFADAQTWTMKVLDTEPRNFYALMGMAAVKTQLQQFKEAAIYLEKAAKLDPKHTDVRFLNGILLLFENAPLLAKSLFTGLESDYPGMEAEEVMKRFFPQ